MFCCLLYHCCINFYIFILGYTVQIQKYMKDLNLFEWFLMTMMIYGAHPEDIKKILVLLNDTIYKYYVNGLCY